MDSGGWTAYDAHRGLPSAAATAAARVLALAAEVRGPDFWREAVAEALRLV